MLTFISFLNYVGFEDVFRCKHLPVLCVEVYFILSLIYI